MTYLCCYDISSARIRYRLARFLGQKSMRVQKSVFVLESTDDEHILIRDFVRNTIDKSDSFIMIPICKRCQKGGMYFGSDPFIQSEVFSIL